jgi:hypothetical protein
MSASSLLFQPGMRPDSAAVRALAQGDGGFSISLDPDESQANEGAWLELLASGLTFDLRGLAPGPAAAAPPSRHVYGVGEPAEVGPLEAITLQPGPHLAGGRTMLPVVRCLAWLTARLAGLDGGRAVAWHPARCWSAPEAFRGGVQRWIEGGPFPAFALAALAPDADQALQSEGLALLVGQELRVAPLVTEDRAAQGRIALRAMHWLVENGPLRAPRQVTGPDGEKLALEPSANRRFVTVRNE